ncbi:Transmembrane_domain-containing protein [Hexamita inflata]|uniref:Transmembrane domain-containing protein n=1 Tax=Hexamita inflata TaxID=28002 RepID=A0AA86UZI0_9EUKA|nr:Transmembrane domain-containing protein [Hexamita inflata]
MSQQITNIAVLSYQVSGYVVIALTAALMVASLCGSIRNKFADWTPHTDLFVYLLGNMCTTVSFIISWYYAYESIYELPLYYLGEALSLTSLLILCNKQNFIANQLSKQYNPFYACRLGSSGKKFIKQWFIYVIPNAIFVVLAIVGLVLFESLKTYFNILNLLESIFCVYLTILIILSSLQYKKWCDQNDQTETAHLIVILAWLCLIDCFLSHFVFILVVTIIKTDKETKVIILYLKDWVSLLMNAVIDVVVFKILKLINLMMKDLQNLYESDVDDIETYIV